MSSGQYLLLILLLHTLIAQMTSASIGGVIDVADVRMRQPRATHKDQRKAKKDIFVSRGWGAGGMPFNVLYMNRSHARSVQTPKASKTQKEAKGKARKGPTIRFGRPLGHHPIIPQLFVSYRWSHVRK